MLSGASSGPGPAAAGGPGHSALGFLEALAALLSTSGGGRDNTREAAGLSSPPRPGLFANTDAYLRLALALALLENLGGSRRPGGTTTPAGSGPNALGERRAC